MTKIRLDGAALAGGLERVVSLLRRLAAGDRISLTTADTLRTLDTGGPCRISELAALEGVTQPAMTQLVSRLEHDGLVERRSHPDDARVVMVHLTAAGAERLQARREARARLLDELAGRLSGDDRDALAAALPALERLVAAQTTYSGSTTT
ncbi:MarR family winged helix-turn-helix transcriptional regulator [Dactylosporangium sp. CA-139066]|uniref:MarR family winged helix-turn-helix transcriptional regulator n=1 Tax=Dactylosporangium sp. CA-139066 TaxID=3239930 RepID=UPI003D932F5B